MWDLISGLEIALVEQAHSGEVRGLCKLMDKWVLSGGSEGTIKVWEVCTDEFKQVKQMILSEGEEDRVSCVLSYSQDDQVFQDHIVVFTEMKHYYFYKVSHHP